VVAVTGACVVVAVTGACVVVAVTGAFVLGILSGIAASLGNTSSISCVSFLTEPFSFKNPTWCRKSAFSEMKITHKIEHVSNRIVTFLFNVPCPVGKCVALE
jgi:hypothetical protein